jgi:hypothetical protein
MHILVHEIDGEEDACAATVLPLAEGYLADCPENFWPTNVLAYTPTDGDAVQFETELVRILPEGGMRVHDADDSTSEEVCGEVALQWSLCADQTPQSGKAVYYAGTDLLTSLQQLISLGGPRGGQLYKIAAEIGLPGRRELRAGGHVPLASSLFTLISQDMMARCETVDALRLLTFEQFQDEMDICAMLLESKSKPEWMEDKEPLSYWHLCYCWGELVRSCILTRDAIKHLEETVSPAPMLGNKVELFPAVGVLLDNIEVCSLYLDMFDMEGVHKISRESYQVLSPSLKTPKNSGKGCVVLHPCEFAGAQFPGAVWQSSQSTFTGSVMQNLADKGIGLDHTPLLLDSRSPLWPFVVEHLGQKLYTQDATLYTEAVVIDQQQGVELIGGKMCYLVKTPKQREIAIVLSQKSIIKAMVTSIADVIHLVDVQKRLDLLDSKKGMVHMKQEQKPANYRGVCRRNMARIHALKGLARCQFEIEAT